MRLLSSSYTNFYIPILGALQYSSGFAKCLGKLLSKDSRAIGIVKIPMLIRKLTKYMTLYSEAQSFCRHGICHKLSSVGSDTACTSSRITLMMVVG
jgi:hypothetical protein